jgi:hypothetical protein
MRRSASVQSRSIYSIDELAIFHENFYTPPLAGEITHVQCAQKTPEKDAQAQVQKAAPASKVRTP